MMGTPNTPGTLKPWMPQQSPAALGWSWPICAPGAGRVPRKGSVCPRQGQGGAAWLRAPLNPSLAVLWGVVSGDGGAQAVCSAHGGHAWHARGCLGLGWHRWCSGQ